MKRFSLLLLTLFICVCVSAQTEKKLKRIELNNEEVLIGYVERQNDGDYLITNEAGDIFYYSQAEVKGIYSLEHKPAASYEVVDDPIFEVKKSHNKTSKKTEIPQRGYMGILEGGCAIPGLSSMGYSALLINGYQISPYFYLGVGLGYYFDDYTDDNTISALPAFLHSRISMSKKRVAPFFAFSGGVSYNIPDESFYPYADFALGLRHNFKNGNNAMWYSVSIDMRVLCQFKLAFAF